jgi:hypothetical protein
LGGGARGDEAAWRTHLFRPLALSPQGARRTLHWTLREVQKTRPRIILRLTNGYGGRRCHYILRCADGNLNGKAEVRIQDF